MVTVASSTSTNEAPVHEGEIAEIDAEVAATGTVVVEGPVEMHSEAPLTGERRRCGRGQADFAGVYTAKSASQ
jgi:acyl-CoA hydrolase